MLNLFDWFVNIIAGSPFMAVLILEALYAIILMLGKTSFHSMMLIIGITFAIWMTVLFGMVWYTIFLIGSLVYLWFSISKFISREQ